MAVQAKQVLKQESKQTPGKQYQLEFRPAVLDDLDALQTIENTCFDIDRMSRRSMKWMIQKGNCDFIVAVHQGEIIAYILVLYHRGTHLARIYSLAVLPSTRGMGVGEKLLHHAEELAEENNCIYMRLEVHPNNKGAIQLYEKNAYLRFGVFKDYYEDHSDAVRYQKRILYPDEQLDFMPVPYYQQTTLFTCGPASLMMAMNALNKNIKLDRSLELQLWREATTIYMTSGHGGCSPLGLALAAYHRGFRVELYLNTREPLFLDGVRSEAKKAIMELVHADFLEQIKKTDIELHYRDISIEEIDKKYHEGGVPLVLISSYLFDRTKAPHWVVVSGTDDTFIYIHDPEVDEETFRSVTDNIYLPIARESFKKAFKFGQSALKTCVIIHPRVS